MYKIFGSSTKFQVSPWDDDQTITAEIFGVERSKQHARSLAESQIVSETALRIYSIIDRLGDNATALLEAYRQICGAVAEGKTVTPAAEWLIDNYHLVEEHVRQTRADLPEGFYKQLPKLAAGPLAGHPRIFGLVWAYVAHNDSRFEPSSLTEFVNEYQSIQPLTIGELWAVSISLRLILIENLRRVSQRIMQARNDRDSADVFAEVLLNSDSSKTTFDKLRKSSGDPKVTQQFAVQLIQRLRDHNGLAAEALQWLKIQTEALGYSFETAVGDEHHRQAAANVTVRNIVTSMRFISDVNWEVWFDSVSLVDKLLRTSSNYTAMDFPSRTIYRTAVEELARGSETNEIDVAQKALALGGDDPGHHLIGNGRAALEHTLNFKPPTLRRLRMSIRSAGLRGYVGGFLLLTFVALFVGAMMLMKTEVSFTLMTVLLVLAILPASDFGLATLNYIITRIMDAAIIPGLALREGVPSSLRTLVVVPVLLTSRDDVEELVDRLEVHFLSNADGELYFGLLTDYTDAATETMPQDESLLDAALQGIARLNQRHSTDRFILLHRARKWNAKQGAWMGWERKRGKLHELNRLLRGAEDTSFIVIGGKLPAAVRFVITLDADTRLPRDAARRLVGKMAHPLNWPKFDTKQARVTEGYGVLQPRVTPSLPVGHYGSMFQRIYSSSRGIDPYVFAVSDVYQDLFGEGSFAGKGIYDVDAFESALAQKVPEDTMLSHDLFEGVFARAALVTDIEVVEEFPERYGVAAVRQHRWTRGDWQLLPWLFGQNRVSIPALGKWKMLDNLRRSIVPISAILALMGGWLFLPQTVAVFWTVFIALLSIIPPFLPLVAGLIPKKMPLTIASRVRSSAEDFGLVAALVATNLLFMGHQAGLMLDAIFRTLYRLIISQRKLLEWTTAAQSDANHKPSPAHNYSLMAASVIAGLLAISVAALSKNWFIAMPFAIAWLAAPAVAYWMSMSPNLEDALAASPEDRKTLRLVARRTWRYFETFVTRDDNFLPPDNFQEQPKPQIAHRTSPTNIGLYLLSVASAREFGWVGLADAVEKLEVTLAAMKRLETFKGHLYNWYDTTDLRPLEPKYISTVDSGNLAGHLIALSNYCSHWILHPGDTKTCLDGIVDILDIMVEELGAIPDDRRILRPVRKQLLRQIDDLSRSLNSASQTPETILLRMVEFGLQAAKIHETVVSINADLDSGQSENLLRWADSLRATTESHFRDISVEQWVLKKRLQVLMTDTRQFALAMEFGFLQDPKRLLLSIGYRVPESMRDESCYDLLASEARLGSYFAIAKGDLRTRHWFRLGRTVTAVRGGAALISWSGSMFEYLMPSLVMRAPSASLLDQTAHLIVERQIAYGNSLGIPWGISESAFNARDIEFTYQYSNFGVPGLGLKRGLSGNTVIAPYATGLAAMVAPRASAQNYSRLVREGARGHFGFYEALDYTPSRLRKGENVAVVQAYFAHHQGMSIVAIFNAVKNGEMRSQFHAEPMIRATELLLQERATRNVPVTNARIEANAEIAAIREDATPINRSFGLPENASPNTHLLSNGEYTVMLTAAGGGFSTWKGTAISRWREDGVRDDWGSYFYLRDIKGSKVWSAGYMPVATKADRYDVTFTEDKAEFIRKDGNFTTTMECVVSPEDNAEARRVTITNTGLSAKYIELTTYVELVLASQASDDAHPAFSKMFVETEFVNDHQALLATRRQRVPGEQEIWVAQFMLVQGQNIGQLEFETDRARFIGMGNEKRLPASLLTLEKLSNTVGTVLDPIFSLRQRLRVPAGRLVRCTVWTVVANTREAVLELVDRHRQPMAYDRAIMLAWTQAQIQLRHLSIDTEMANLYQALASHLIFANATFRPPSKTLEQNIGSQAALWPNGISGDRPILLVRIDEIEDIELVHQILQAIEYWNAKGLYVDLVILNDRMSSYVQDLQNAIEALTRKISVASGVGKIHVLRADLVSPETLRVLPSIARVVLYGRRGTLSEQLRRVQPSAAIVHRNILAEPKSITAKVNSSQLEFFNGFGGFEASSREYVIVLGRDKPSPAPWINVIANENFGFQSSADGGGYTWFGNARENQISAWSNDAVVNRQGEVIYIRDDSDGVLMSPTLAPLRSNQGTHIARHGFGYTVFERKVHNIRMDLLQLVPVSDAIKLSRLKLTNEGTTTRQLTITAYVEWVLGTPNGNTAPFITTAVDDITGAILARNPWKIRDGQQVAFMDMGGAQTSWTGDRREFLGQYGELASPAALSNEIRLSKSVGAGLDPCSALQTHIVLAPGETRELIISLGAANNLHEVQELVERYRKVVMNDVLDSVIKHWQSILNTVQVKTPDRSFDILMNGWLQYQTLACRMWARSGFYQTSGAYGFRDQLQDSMALLTTRPVIARDHLLRAAARQFVEGDFQHWWLPSSGMGVRTRISDDNVWLAFCAVHYINVTGDNSVLDETVSFLEGQALTPGEHDAFFQPAISETTATLYEHCARALDLSLAQGVHGLPLIGTGDWNDGMNRVGEVGRGESVWLGWFLLKTLNDLLPYAIERGDTGRSTAWNDRIITLQSALEAHGWDGSWYRRGYFDDGSLLGSSENQECRIDAIAQSWAVLSGGASPERALSAMDQSYTQLVRPEDKLFMLFTPPFDKSDKDPGYIKAYPPGIRENGGQYTHGVIWSIFAHAKLGQNDRANQLFSMLNPINHALTEIDAKTYKVEPYVIAADVYSVAPHVGRGGWTWYTGSAGWMYRAGLEAILGVTLEANLLRIKPCIAEDWPGFEFTWKFGETIYIINITRSDDSNFEHQEGVAMISAQEFTVSLRDSGGTRHISLPMAL